MKVCHFRDDFSNAFVTKRQTDRLRREAFGVRRIPALCESSARREAKAPEYGALQTLRAVRLRLCRLCRAEDPARRDALPADRLRSSFRHWLRCEHGRIEQRSDAEGRAVYRPELE